MIKINIRTSADILELLKILHKYLKMEDQIQSKEVLKFMKSSRGPTFWNIQPIDLQIDLLEQIRKIIWKNIQLETNQFQKTKNNELLSAIHNSLFILNPSYYVTNKSNQV